MAWTCRESESVRPPLGPPPPHQRPGTRIRIVIKESEPRAMEDPQWRTPRPSDPLAEQAAAEDKFREIPRDPGREADGASAHPCPPHLRFSQALRRRRGNLSLTASPADHGRQGRPRPRSTGPSGSWSRPPGCSTSPDQPYRLRARLRLPLARPHALHRVQSDHRIPQRRDPPAPRGDQHRARVPGLGPHRFVITGICPACSRARSPGGEAITPI